MQRYINRLDEEVKMSYVIKTIDDDIKMCEVRANYWMAMATTGAGRKRSLSHGTMGPELTDLEKDADCMDTALRHIRGMQELVDHKKEILYEQRKSHDRVDCSLNEGGFSS
jgi:hypothetical protein